MKGLLFCGILVVSCNHSTASSTPQSSTVTIPSATASSVASAEPAPSTAPAAATNADPCALPSPWPVDQALFEKGGDVEILAWRQRSDDRPLFIDEALVWQHGKAGWTLAQVYRHPKEENQFRLSVVCDAPYQPEKSYDHAPTAKDVKDFLSNTTWPHELDGFTLDAGKVCNGNWSRTIGAPPPPHLVK